MGSGADEDFDLIFDVFEEDDLVFVEVEVDVVFGIVTVKLRDQL